MTALSVERDELQQIVSLTVYSFDGTPLASLRPDGSVDVKQGSPEDAARAFFKVLTNVLTTQCNKPQQP